MSAVIDITVDGTICLNMIVRNEAAVISRCLNSVRSIINAWVIVDTGSNDETPQIIYEQLADVPGELYQRPWKNFGFNRSEALELARPHGDYIFFIDADDCLQIDPAFVLPLLDADCYDLMVIDAGLEYQRRALVKSALPWRYVGPVHEYVTCATSHTHEFLPGLRICRLHEGVRSRDPGTYRRDALLFESALLDEPDNARYVFYLAQSYRDAGDLELALRHYRRRAQMGGWAEEVWYSLYQIGVIRERMSAPWSEVMEAYLTAFNYQSDRAEPLYQIARYYQNKAATAQLADLFLRRACQVPNPSLERLFVDRAIYDYLINIR